MRRLKDNSLPLKPSKTCFLKMGLITLRARAHNCTSFRMNVECHIWVIFFESSLHFTEMFSDLYLIDIWPISRYVMGPFNVFIRYTSCVLLCIEFVGMYTNPRRPWDYASLIRITFWIGLCLPACPSACHAISLFNLHEPIF